jgi:transcription initiation factor TFIIF subunit beta
MNDLSVEDERKPFEVSMEGLQEEETQPDPDEQLMLDQGNGKVWLVKVRSRSFSINSHFHPS